MEDVRSKPVLVLDDEALIGLDVQGAFARLGFNRVAMFTSRVEAKEWLEWNKPSIAMLDIYLRDGQCSDIAASLLAANVPFVVHSGVPRANGGFDPVFLQAIWISKPFQDSELVEILSTLLTDLVP